VLDHAARDEQAVHEQAIHAAFDLADESRHTPEPEAPRQASPLPPSTSAVIGRYEADGTSYVMYADGSIEAQSEAGIYRFNSMSELKEFIENASPFPSDGMR
jgi:hypothetical protein